MTDPTIQKIAEGLDHRKAQVLVGCDPDRVEGSVADLLNLVLDGLAEVRPDNSLFLLPRGFQVRAYLTARSEG